MNLQRSGISECTAPGGKREDIVVAGVIKDGNGYKAVSYTHLWLTWFYRMG